MPIFAESHDYETADFFTSSDLKPDGKKNDLQRVLASAAQTPEI